MSRPKSARSRKRPAGIREIAQSVGTSIGTVDRALHDRPGINPETRAKILDVAQKLGYRPNLAARFLSSQKELRIGINLPREIASFWDVIRQGIADIAESAETSGVEIVPRSYPRLGDGEVEALERALKDDVQGLVIAPGGAEDLAPAMRKAAARGIPMVCVNTDAASVAHLATVCVDSVVSGSLVAELMARFLGGKGRLIVVTGQLDTIDHAQKLEGLRAVIQAFWPELEIAAVLEAHDDETEAYDKCRKALRSIPDATGIYVSTANSVAVMRALDDSGRGERVSVIATDLFPALAEHIETGRVAATLYQRPWAQGQIAFQALYKFLAEGVAPPPVIRLSPHIVMRSNLKLFLDRLPSEKADARGKSGSRHERGRSLASFADEIA
jgi:LacI family transcriptional regulator